jgi:superfamily II DNA or RNA helicase
MINKRFIKDFSYPDYDDKDFLTKIYKKREFYYYKVQRREIFKESEYDKIKKYRDDICKVDNKEPTEQQLIIPNFISPNTLYRGILLMHGVGTGKTMAAIKLAEQFKDQIKTYNTKIHVLVPGPNTKKNFEKELLVSTDNTYLNNNLLKNMSKDEIEKEKRAALYNALQYYKIISYKSFHKKVLGEKIIEKTIVGDTKIKGTYKKNEEGEFEREIMVDKIINLNNSIIIVDEAHNISNNEYGEALKIIIKNSENIRIILMTATPMINFADEIVNLLNFIRPLNDQIERDKIFTAEKSYLMKLKDNGLEYLQDKARGLISYYRGSIPYTFAKRIDKGEIPKGLLFTSVIKCKMNDFQNKIYNTISNVDDIMIDKISSFTSGIILLGNFVFPGLNKEKNDLVGFYTSEGLTVLLAQIASDGPKLCSLINQKIYGGKFSNNEENSLIMSRNKNITGLILKKENIKHFSTKYYSILNNISKLVNNYVATAFIYSNFVNVGGIDLLSETFIQNGYLEYQNDYNNYDINDDTLDYKTGLTFSEYKKIYDVSFFRPSTFLLITGGTDESHEEVSEIKQKYIQDVFNNSENIDGKNIKFILGSKVMNEGITLKNVKEVHILEPFFNISKIEQVIGRAIRYCVHMDVIQDDDPSTRFPEVNIYRYVISSNDLGANLSTDEILYKKAEIKYLLIKKVERALKEIAIDCPLLLNANVFPEEIEKYKNCKPPTIENINKGEKICPALCDFRECNFKCDNSESKLNKNYFYTTANGIGQYKDLDKNEIDYNTYQDLSLFEINFIKNQIINLFKIKHIYLYDEILNLVKKSYKDFQSNLFENIYLDIALEYLMPQTENDFNNFKDIIYDKFNKPGYIIQRDKYYIFQPSNESENIPLYYRKNINIDYYNQVSIKNYIKQNFKNYINDKLDLKLNDTDSKLGIKKTIYNFEDTLEYYSNRDENFIVGIIDKNLNKNISDEDDIFKIRPPLLKYINKKRGSGIVSFKGTVCYTYEDKTYLFNLLKKLNAINCKEKTNLNFNIKDKNAICKSIQNKLLELEKYSTSKDNNKKTYIIIPYNHPKYIFPYNIEDRILYIINNINKIIGHEIKYNVNKNNSNYIINIQNEDKLSYVKHILNKYDFKLNNNIYSTTFS